MGKYVFTRIATGFFVLFTVVTFAVGMIEGSVPEGPDGPAGSLVLPVVVFVAPVGPGVGVVTVAAFASDPEAPEAIVPNILTVAVCPAGRLPSDVCPVHAPVGLAAPVGPTTAVYCGDVIAVGTLSLTEIFVAPAGPLLYAVIVYVTVSPGR